MRQALVGLPTRDALVVKPLPATMQDGMPVTGLPEALAELDGRLVRTLRETELPGMTLAVAQSGQVVATRGYGKQGDLPIEPTMPAMLCSLCKPLTAQAFLLLAQEGKLSLEDSASRWLSPDRLSVDPRITLRHLLTHRSGLPVKVPLISSPLTEPLAFPPGAGFLYSNLGYQLLGRILETLTGERPGSTLQKRILTPLGVRSYFVATDLSTADQKRFDSGNAYVLTPNHYNRETRRHAPVHDRVLSLAKEALGRADTCGAGCMSAPDYLRFMLSITPAQRQRIRKNATDGYGLGWMLQGGGLAHTGIGSGETHYALTQERGVSYVCFIPSSNDDACERVLEVVKTHVGRLQLRAT